VSLAGVGPLTLDLSARQVANVVDGPILGLGASSSASLYVPICSGAMQGTAYFFGPGGALHDPSNDHLISIWFMAGAKTRRGVGIGSTRAEVRRAYGTQQLHTGPNGLYIVGQRLAQARVRPAVYFVFERNKVTVLGFGSFQVLRSDASVLAMPIVHC